MLIYEDVGYGLQPAFSVKFVVNTYRVSGWLSMVAAILPVDVADIPFVLVVLRSLCLYLYVQFLGYLCV